ncbi:MAG: transglutaminase domain-containing protein [Candidatus Woesearchaeota archaeon]
MKKEGMLLLLSMMFLLAPAGAASDDAWFQKSSYLVLEPVIRTSFSITADSPNQVEYVIANISFFPRETRTQRVLEEDYDPEPSKSDSMLSFRWDNPDIGDNSIRIKSRVKTSNRPLKIKDKVEFPIDESEIPDEYDIYLQPSELIDTNSRIRNLASELASGNDDLFKAVDNLAVWVNTNIEYNLTTFTAEAAQKSSWVLENREGVCDEITSLFISMARSLGIPARFVSGISYTNLQEFDDRWGPHGWAEVYFPGYGWVPYDVTYGEYAWIDPTHIEANMAEDASKFTSRYVWKAEKGVELESRKLDMDVDIIEKGEALDPSIQINADTVKENVGFGSYNLVSAELRNMKDHYQSFDAYLSRTSRLEYPDGNKRHITLRPGETKTVYWIVRTGDDLQKGYMYTFPFSVHTSGNISSSASFASAEDADYFSFSFMNATKGQLRVEEKKVYSAKVAFNCSTGKKEYYEYEKPEIQCTLKNKGNTFLKGLNVCMDSVCTRKNTGITEEKRIGFTVEEKIIGTNEVMIKAENEDVSKMSYVRFDVLETPNIGINDVSYPSNATYEGDYNLGFRLEKETGSSPQDVKLRARINREIIEKDIGSLDDDMDFEIAFSGKELTPGENPIRIEVDYTDRNGREYGLEEEYSVRMEDVSWFQKLMIFLRTLF